MSGNLRHINAVMNSQMFAESGKAIEREVNIKEEVKSVESSPSLVHESCNCSGFTMAAVAGALLLFAGIFLYALVV